MEFIDPINYLRLTQQNIKMYNRIIRERYTCNSSQTRVEKSKKVKWTILLCVSVFERQNLIMLPGARCLIIQI